MESEKRSKLEIVITRVERPTTSLAAVVSRAVKGFTARLAAKLAPLAVLGLKYPPPPEPEDQNGRGES